MVKEEYNWQLFKSITYCAATWFLFFKFQSLIRWGSHEGWLKAKNKQTLILLIWNCNWVSTEKGSYVKDFEENLLSWTGIVNGHLFKGLQSWEQKKIRTLWRWMKYDIYNFKCLQKDFKYLDVMPSNRKSCKRKWQLFNVNAWLMFWMKWYSNSVQVKDRPASGCW